MVRPVALRSYPRNHFGVCPFEYSKEISLFVVTLFVVCLAGETSPCLANETPPCLARETRGDGPDFLADRGVFPKCGRRLLESVIGMSLLRCRAQHYDCG